MDRIAGANPLASKKNLPASRICSNPKHQRGSAQTLRNRWELVRIEWPSGTVQELRDVAANQFLIVTEPARLQALGAGGLRIQLWKGMTFEVPTSTNLNQWPPLNPVTNLTGTLEFTDPNAANQESRFYRAVLR